MAGIELPDPIEAVERPLYLQYHYIATDKNTRFLHELRKGRIIGERSPGTGKVLVPPGVCPECGQPTRDEGIELADSGCVLSYTTVHLPIPGSALKPPFVVANVLLDGADQTISHLVGECEPSAVTIGSRVVAKWRPEAERGFGLENIEYFVLSGEPDVDIDALKAQRLEEAAKHA